VIGMYESSPKVKYREGMCDASQLIAELKSRSCVDFVRSTQAEIVCQFRRDRVPISPGVILVFAGVRLRFEKSSPR